MSLMRKRLLILLSVLGLGAAVIAITAGALAMTQVREIKVFGDGVIPTGPQRDGIFSFLVRLPRGGQVSGTMRFVEVSPDQQLNLVELPVVEQAEFSEDSDSGVFQGPGYLNGEPVWVVVQVEDRRGPRRPGPRDEFGVACFSGGRLVFGGDKKTTKTGHVTLLK
jgi:hypothetical protein